MRRYDMATCDLENPDSITIYIKRNSLGVLNYVTTVKNGITYTIWNNKFGFVHSIYANDKSWGYIKKSKFKNRWKVQQNSCNKYSKYELMECYILSSLTKREIRIMMLEDGSVHKYRDSTAGLNIEPPIRDLFYERSRMNDVISFKNCEKLKFFSTNYPEKVLCYYDAPMSALSSLCAFFIQYS